MAAGIDGHVAALRAAGQRLLCGPLSLLRAAQAARERAGRPSELPRHRLRLELGPDPSPMPA